MPSARAWWWWWPRAIRNGDENPDACKYSPARVSAAITVGATAGSDARPGYSYFGGCLDLFAPGSDIACGVVYREMPGANVLNGTSMAAPHVSVRRRPYGGESRGQPGGCGE